MHIHIRGVGVVQHLLLLRHDSVGSVAARASRKVSGRPEGQRGREGRARVDERVPLRLSSVALSRLRGGREGKGGAGKHTREGGVDENGGARGWYGTRKE